MSADRAADAGFPASSPTAPPPGPAAHAADPGAASAYPGAAAPPPGPAAHAAAAPAAYPGAAPAPAPAPAERPLIEPSTTDHPLYEMVVEACRTVYDPEIPVNIFDLGLIYTIAIAPDDAVTIRMSLTAPGCPVAGEMPGWVADAVNAIPGVRQVDVHMTFDPPWGMDMMSDEARLELGFM